MNNCGYDITTIIKLTILINLNISFFNFYIRKKKKIFF